MGITLKSADIPYNVLLLTSGYQGNYFYIITCNVFRKYEKINLNLLFVFSNGKSWYL